MIIGQIESYDSETKTGFVKDQEEFFKFDVTSWVSSLPPDQGDEVTFELRDGVVVNMRLVAETMKPIEGIKKRWIATTLAIFFRRNWSASFLFRILQTRISTIGIYHSNTGIWCVMGGY